MSKNVDLFNALEHKTPSGFVPRWELEFHAWDAASGKHAILGHEFEKLSPAEQEKAMHQNAELFISVSEELGFSALTVPSSYWNHAPGELAYWCMPGDTRYRQAAILGKMAPPSLTLFGITGGIMGADYSPEFCYSLVDDPESIDQLVTNRLADGIESAKRYRDCGIKAAVAPADIADNSGPFFNPDQMNRWILPKLTEWSNTLRAMGMYSIFHTDGKLYRYMDAIASTGIDALQAIDPVAGMDMKTTLSMVGNRLCLCGNIDCGLLVRGSPEEVYQSTKDLLVTCKDQGSMILGASNAVQPEVPVENYRAMICAWKEFGQYK
ncbi:MAG: uroporphyrinogen decarboxylase family protein [Verrucomicrobiota bacterium]|nr:uroporphyrinogen decarboxylase family protein [Verrucomicrobiota bacterium]